MADCRLADQQTWSGGGPQGVTQAAIQQAVVQRTCSLCVQVRQTPLRNGDVVRVEFDEDYRFINASRHLAYGDPYLAIADVPSLVSFAREQ